MALGVFSLIAIRKPRFELLETRFQLLDGFRFRVEFRAEFGKLVI
jgi:hypothetical protein